MATTHIRLRDVDDDGSLRLRLPAHIRGDLEIDEALARVRFAAPLSVEGRIYVGDTEMLVDGDVHAELGVQGRGRLKIAGSLETGRAPDADSLRAVLAGMDAAIIEASKKWHKEEMTRRRDADPMAGIQNAGFNALSGRSARPDPSALPARLPPPPHYPPDNDEDPGLKPPRSPPASRAMSKSVLAAARDFDGLRSVGCASLRAGGGIRVAGHLHAAADIVAGAEVAVNGNVIVGSHLIAGSAIYAVAIWALGLDLARATGQDRSSLQPGQGFALPEKAPPPCPAAVALSPVDLLLAIHRGDASTFAGESVYLGDPLVFAGEDLVFGWMHAVGAVYAGGSLTGLTDPGVTRWSRRTDGSSQGAALRAGQVAAVMTWLREPPATWMGSGDPVGPELR